MIASSCLRLNSSSFSLFCSFCFCFLVFFGTFSFIVSVVAFSVFTGDLVLGSAGD